MKREVRIEGTTFTRRRKVIERTETAEEMTEGLRELARWSKDPWAAQRETVEWIERALEQERAEHGADHRFKPHEDAGWYLEELHCFARMADLNIEKGDASWAAYAGAKFGEIWNEFQMQTARGELYCQAAMIRDNCSAAGKKSKHPSTAQERASAVRRHLQDHPNLKQAYALAADELTMKHGRPIKARTVRRAWEDAQKS